MMLGNFSARCPTTVDHNSSANAYCAFSRCGSGFFFFFFCFYFIAPTISFIFFLSVGDGSKKTGILSQRAVFKPKATNQPMAIKTMF